MVGRWHAHIRSIGSQIALVHDPGSRSWIEKRPMWLVRHYNVNLCEQAASRFEFSARMRGRRTTGTKTPFHTFRRPRFLDFVTVRSSAPLHTLEPAPPSPAASPSTCAVAGGDRPRRERDLRRGDRRYGDQGRVRASPRRAWAARECRSRRHGPHPLQTSERAASDRRPARSRLVVEPGRKGCFKSHSASSGALNFMPGRMTPPAGRVPSMVLP